jgi:hypothetical protein
MERDKIAQLRMFINSSYGTSPRDHSVQESLYRQIRDLEIDERESKILKFATHGKEMSHSAMSQFITMDVDRERPIKLTDISFSEPFQGIIATRPSVYGVTSVHYIAGYKIVIKRYADTSDQTVWCETPMGTYHCTFGKLERLIHENLLEAIQRDSKWETLK